MKRVLVYCALSAVLWMAGPAARAVQPPASKPLPNFDQRLRRLAPEAAELSPEKAYAVQGLKARVPGLRVQVDRLLAAPNHLASPQGFLTGPHAATEDPHRALKTFLRENASAFGYGPEILDAARVKTDYTDSHNGLRTTVWEQQVGDTPVFEAILISRITRAGELVSLSTYLMRNLGNPPAAPDFAALPVTPVQAVVAAAADLEAPLAPGQVLPAQERPDPAAKVHRFRAEPVLKGEIIVREVCVTAGPGEWRAGWEVFVVPRARPTELYQTVVDAQSGEVLLRRFLTAYISDVTYNVFPGDSPSPFSPGHPNPSPVQPPLVPRQMLTLAALNTNASPNGWIDDNQNETLGNNVDAHMDWNDDDQPDIPRPQGATNRVFDFALDLTTEPTNYGPASVVQLFYWNNWVHDKFYDLGFTEAAGNYQQFNFGRGGFGLDPVMADCQDAALINSPFTRNNAFWMPRPDGYSPRMGMFIWDGPTPDRDGSLDAEIILHEATHGLSMRLVGAGLGMYLSQSRGLGEGWSDFYALSLLSEPNDNQGGNYGAAAYSSYQLGVSQDNYYYGLRRYPYATDLTKNPLTFKDIDPDQADPHQGVPMNPDLQGYIPAMSDEEHFQGEVWCATLWEARANLIRKYGYAVGNQQILQLATDAMKLGPANPNFLQARDAILQADLVNNGGANYNEIWRAFAKRGMGGSASSPPSYTTRGVEEAFDMPGLSFVSAAVIESITSNGNGAVDLNECNELSIVLVNNSRTNFTSITAVLSSVTPGVVVAQADSAYPNATPGERTTNATPFRIYTQPGFICGTPIRLELLIRTAQEARTIRARLDSGLLGAPLRFDNSVALPIPDADVNGVDSFVTVSGMSNAIGRVTVSLHITHTFDYDLDIQLIGPDGTAIALSRNNGIYGTNFGNACFPDFERTTFDDKASLPISMAQPPYVGSFQPDQPLARFNLKSGFAVNGNWRLHISDVLSNDVGTLQCWSLNLYPVSCADGLGQCPADLGIVQKVAPLLPVAGSNLTVQVTVTNQGPSDAFNVMLTNVHPDGMMLLAAFPSRGSCTNLGDRVVCDLGTVPDHGAATVNFLLRPTVPGTHTNFASVVTSVPDLNPFNNESTFLFDVRPAAPLIVAAGSALISESYSPPSGALEIGEEITLDLALRNIGAFTASNLVATLQNSGGVTAPSGPQVYGQLAAGGPAVARTFSFNAQGTNGGGVIATLRLQDGTRDLGAVTFNFGLSSELSYSHLGSIVVPNTGPAALYPAPIFVSGLFGQVHKVTATLHDLNHSFPDDLDILLVGPGGQGVLLMSDAGGGADLRNTTLTFDDAGSALSDQNAVLTGIYHPADFELGDQFPAPAPAGPYRAQLSAFTGSDPNGMWSLFILDDQQGDSGRLNGGWTLQLSLLDPVNSTADLQVGVAAEPRNLLPGGRIAYTINVANAGPDQATGVVLTNVLPANFTQVAVTFTQGACENLGGTVRCALGTISNSATVTITGTATASGSLALVASASGNERDPNPGNSGATGIAQVNPLADLALAFAPATPAAVRGRAYTYDLVVSNLGPDIAYGVQVTNLLPAAAAFVDAVVTQGSWTQSLGVVRCTFPSVAPGSPARLTITVQAPNSVTAITNSAGVFPANPADPALTNNLAVMLTAVNDPSVIVVSAGCTLVAEQVPYTGGIEPGERVALNFALRNVGVSNANTLRATLRNVQGVTGASEPADYGSLAAGGTAVTRAFQFTAAGASGDTLYATLDLQDGANNLGTVTFPFVLGGVQRSFARLETVSIPDNSRAQPYPSIINVSGLTGSVGRVVVSLVKLSHGYPDDLDVLLVTPQGQGVVLMSDVGGSQPVANLTITFDDAAQTALSNDQPLQSGVFKTGNFLADDSFPFPAPTGPYGSSLSVLNGASPNGDWALYVVDDMLGDSGALEGWNLSITTVGLINFPATRLEAARIVDGRFRCTLTGRPGDIYRIEASDDLAVWNAVGIYTLGDGPFQFSDPQSPNAPRRFYRALRMP